MLELREVKMDELIAILLETLSKEPMTPTKLAEKLKRGLGEIETALRFMWFKKWVKQDGMTRIVSITTSGLLRLQTLKQNSRH